jgi:hypothetical protein
MGVVAIVAACCFDSAQGGLEYRTVMTFMEHGVPVEVYLLYYTADIPGGVENAEPATLDSSF